MFDNIVLNKDELEEISYRLGQEITDTLKNEKKIPVIVGVMKGSMNFMMDLIKYIEVPIFTDYIQISSYAGTKSTGRIQLIKDLSYECEGRSVVIVEDIVDTGKSMHYLIEHIMTHNPRNIYVCSLFDKKPARVIDVNVDFVGKELTEDTFLIGYGLDYNELCRELPYVFGATNEDIEELDKILKNDDK